MKFQDSIALNLILLTFCIATGAFGILSIALFAKQSKALKDSLSEIAGDLRQVASLHSFSDEVEKTLNSIFSRIPALSVCYRVFFQAMIPPQLPYEIFYRRGRTAQDSFDPEVILRNSLRIQSFKAVPGILVTFGILGSVIGFALTILHAQPLIEGADTKALGSAVSSIFYSGGFAFLPMALALVFAAIFQIFERIRVQQISDIIEAISVFIDSQIPIQTTEQIMAGSLTELKQQHQTIQNFTTTYFATLNTSIMKIFSKQGNITIEDLLTRNSETYLTPLQQQFSGIRKEMLDSMTLIQREISMSTRAITQNMTSIKDEFITINNGFYSNIRTSILEFKETTATHLVDLTRHVFQGFSALEKSSNEINQTQKNLHSNLPLMFKSLDQAISGAADLLVKEVDSLKSQVTHDFLKLDAPTLNLNMARIADNCDIEIELLQQNKAEVMEVTRQLLISTETISTEIHSHKNELMKVLNMEFLEIGGEFEKINTLGSQMKDIGNEINNNTEIISRDLNIRQLAILEEMQTQGVNLSQTVIQTGTEISTRLNDIHIQGIGLAHKVIETGTGISSRLDDISQSFFENYKIFEEKIDRNEATGKDILRETKMNGSELRVQTDELSFQGDELKLQNSEIKLQGSKISKHGKEIQNHINIEMTDFFSQITQKIQGIHSDLSCQVQRMSADFNEKISLMDKSVGKDLHKIGNGLDDVVREFALITQDIEQVRDFLNDLPLSRIEVVNHPLKLQSRSRSETHLPSTNKLAEPKVIARRKAAPGKDSAKDDASPHKSANDSEDEGFLGESNPKGRNAS